MTNYSSLSKDQLISHIYKLQSDFNVFSNQTNQVEELLQQQLEVFETELAEKNKELKEMDSHLIHLQSLKSKIIALETENDLLESTVRMLQAQLELSHSQQSQFIERTAFLENEIELFKNSLNSQNINAETGFKNIQLQWSKSESEYKEKIKSLNDQIDQLTKSKLLLENQLSDSSNAIKEYQQSYQSPETQHEMNKQMANIKAREQHLENSLRKCQNEKQILLNNLKRLTLKYNKLQKVTTMLKLRQHCPVKAYTTPPLDSLA